MAKRSKKQAKKRANKRQSKTQKKNQSYIPAKNTQKKQQDALNPARQTWLFNALDTLFFRESRPMDSLGNAELGSLFPPSARTLIGAIRAALGIINDIDWRAYREQKQQHLLAALIGYGDDLAALRFSGVWLYKNGERLYPAPRNLMQKQDKKEQDKKNRLETVFFLQIANDDELTHCDLGKIRLPRFNKDQAGSRALDNTWLTASAFEAVLAGECPDPKHWITGSDLWVEEPRIGIARNNKTRSVEQGKLYQTKHIRLVDGVQLAIDITGLEQAQAFQTTPPAFIRLGGEGRIASIQVENPPAYIAAPQFKPAQRKIALYLLTPLLMPYTHAHTHDDHAQNNTNAWQPLPNFKTDMLGEQTVWIGTLNTIDLVLHTAIIGKAHQEGGWDLVNNQPRAVQNYLPAGSVFYCTTNATPEAVIDALHGAQIGDETDLGRGKLAVGQWV